MILLQSTDTDPAIEKLRWFDIKVINTEDFYELIIRFGFNILITFIIVRLIYYALHKRQEYLFTYFMFNILIFFVCFLMSSAKLSIGFAFGLFAIFSILRYRTLPIPIKEMTYLFIIIGIAVINAISTKKVSISELVATNFAIVAFTYLFEKIKLPKTEVNRVVIYEKIENIKPENEDSLMKDLRVRTGMPVHRVEIGRTDFMRDTARIRIFYYEEDIDPNPSET